MQADGYKTWLELGGFAAIVLSLILLVFEIRQNTLAVRTSALQQHLEQHATMVLAALQNPELRAIETKAQQGLGQLSGEEAVQYILYNWNIMRNNFVAFELMQSGVLPRSQWLTFEAALSRRVARSAGIRELWIERRDEMPPEFRQLVDAMVEVAGNAAAPGEP